MNHIILILIGVCISIIVYGTVILFGVYSFKNFLKNKSTKNL